MKLASIPAAEEPIGFRRLFFEIFIVLVVTEVLLAYSVPLLAPGAEEFGDAVLDIAVLTVVAAPIILWRCSAAFRRANRHTSHLDLSGSHGVVLTTALILVAGVGLSLFLGYQAQTTIGRDAQAQFDRLTERLASEAQRRTNLPVYGLKGARGVFIASNRVSRSEFLDYVASRDLPKEFPGVVSFGYVEPINRADISNFEALQREDGTPTFNVHGDDRTRDNLYVVKFASPSSGSHTRVGEDFGSSPICRTAIERAVQSGEPTLSGLVTLTREGHPNQVGFIYFVPIYLGSSTPATSAERQSGIKGLVFAPIAVHDALAGVAETAEGKLDMEVFDGTELTQSRLLLDVDNIPVAATDNPTHAVFGGRRFHDVRRIGIGGRDWTFAFSSTPKFEGSIDHITPLVFTISGSVLSVLLSLVIWSFGQGRRRALAVARFVREMNGELTTAKEQADELATRLRAQAALMEVESERMDLALTASSSGTWEWNPVTDEVIFDIRSAAIFGESAMSTRGADWRDRIHPGDLQAARKQIETHVTGETPNFQTVHRVRHKDGSWRWVISCGITVTRGLDGTSTRVVGLLADITERKELEQQLAQSQRLESIGELAAGIAHEINTPIQYVGDNVRFLQTQFQGLLQTINAYTAQLEGPSRTWEERRTEIAAIQKDLDVDFLLKEIPEAIEQSLEGVDRVATIVRAMKDFSHPGSAQKELIDLNRSIQSTVEVCRNRWKYVATVRTDLAADLPPVPCFVAEFNQVVLNLIVNASDAIAEVMPPGTGQQGVIDITSRTVGNVVEVRVVDNGAGIPDAVKGRIFEPFFTTKDIGKGTGQGLAISRNVIVNKHGGTLTFEPVPDGGTAFVIRIPLIDTSIKAQEAA